MKTTIKYICTGLSLCACTCLVNNLPAQAETTNTAVTTTAAGWNRQSVMDVARRVADWQIKDYPENKYAKSEPRGWIAGALYMGMFDWAETEWRQYLLRLAPENLQPPELASR